MGTVIAGEAIDENTETRNGINRKIANTLPAESGEIREIHFTIHSTKKALEKQIQNITIENDKLLECKKANETEIKKIAQVNDNLKEVLGKNEKEKKLIVARVE